jgi:hypothetical protein
MKAHNSSKKQLQFEMLCDIPFQIATCYRGNAMIRRAFLLLGLSIAAAPAAAANYSATLETPAAGRFIARDISWNCGPAACQGATEESRPVVLCQSLAKQAGRIESFVVDGRAFTPAELDRCNASAKASRTQAVAAK